MIQSLYVTNYFENMKKWYAEQGVIFDNWNDRDTERLDNGLMRGHDLFYVPKNASEHMVDELIRRALSISKTVVGEPWLYVGWNTTAMNALTGTRSHIIHRTVPSDLTNFRKPPENIPAGHRQSKWFREGTWELSVFMVTNHARKAEDLEEIYESRIQMKSDIPVDMVSVFILDYPNFRINTLHNTLQAFYPMVDESNLFGYKYDVKLVGPALEMDEKQMAACKSISIKLYEMGKGQLLEEFTKTNE